MRDFKTLKEMVFKLYAILNKKQRRQLIGMLFVIIVGAGFELLGVSSMMPFIESITNPNEFYKNEFIFTILNHLKITESQEVILAMGLAIVLIYIIKNIYLAISSYLQASYGNNTKRELSVLMLKSYMERPYSFFVNSNSGDVMRGVTDDIAAVYDVIANGFKLLSELITIMLIAVYLIITDWILAFGVLIVGLLCMIIIILGLKKKLSRLADVRRVAVAEMNKWIVQSIGGIKDIMIFNRRDHFVKGYNDAHIISNIANTNFTFASALPERVIEAFCVSGIIFTVIFRLNMGVDAATFVPKMAVFAMAAFRVLPSISRSTGYITAFIFCRPCVDATYDNITSAKAYLDSMAMRQCEEKENFIETFQHSIEVDRIEWSYECGKEKILDELSLTINKGELIGIVGESGSGKSTFSDILLGLYKPQNGTIKMDGTDIEFIPKVWSKTIGYVPQTVFLMDDSIRANVVFGDEVVDDNKVWDALDRAFLGDFVRNMPAKLDTIVGERGVKFSGGQRQRVAIARALYSNPQILVLDEATSALDNDTEVAVMEAIDALAGKMTLVIIAHRVSTLKNCNKIYEIVDGKAVERNKNEVVNG